MNPRNRSWLAVWLALSFAAGGGCSSQPADSAPAPASAAPVIRLSGGDPPAIDVVGLEPDDLAALARGDRTEEQWHALFAVYVERGGDRAGQPAMLGSYRIDKDVLRFQPRYPLVRGVSYRAVFHADRLPGRAGSSAKPLETALLIPKSKPAAPTIVEHVYPSKDELPENQLKFYLHFSAPMSRGEAYEHIHLLRDDGKPVTGAFLELQQELWDADQRRFTLFIDPGRIKRGLKPREDLGPVLEAGKRYTLVIDRAWKDGQGEPLKEAYRKAFRAVPLDETQPDPKKWKIEPPAAGTTAAVVVTMPKSLDRALLRRLVWVADDRGGKVPGKVEVTKQETCWLFTPATAWEAGRYQLVADTRLEDLAGNSIARAFEIDEDNPTRPVGDIRTVQVPFDVR